jgi:hypothetical protein
MASNFYVKTSRSIGTGLTKVGGYTVGAGVQTTAIGLSVTNTLSDALSAQSVYINACINDGTNDTYIVKNVLLPAGSSIILIGGDQKMVLQAGYSIKVQSDTSGSVDAIMSVLEIS